MSRPKTDYGKLESLGAVLERWCEENEIKVRRCSEYQWNVTVPEIQVVIAVYPGSGVIWVPKAHYEHTGVIDKSSTKYSFSNKKTLIDELQKIIFAVDMA